MGPARAFTREQKEDLSSPEYLAAEGLRIEARRIRGRGRRGVRSVRAVADLKRAFNADAGKVRVVVFFSPT